MCLLQLAFHNTSALVEAAMQVLLLDPDVTTTQRFEYSASSRNTSSVSISRQACYSVAWHVAPGHCEGEFFQARDVAERRFAAEVCIQIRTPLACTTCASDDETQYLDKDSTRVVRTRRALFVKEIRREKLPYAAVVSVRIRSALVVITSFSKRSRC